MSRTITSIKSQIGPTQKVADPEAALNDQAASGNFTYLLAYADDGILWGKVENKELLTPENLGVFQDISPRLRAETLQEARLFGKHAEYLLWRDGAGFKARLVTDESGEEVDYYDESFILWGTDEVGETQKGFSLVQEADTGIRHTPPLGLKGRHSLCLIVRHYMEDDEAGAAVVTLSRLVDLINGA